jgi:hypothetical protein
MSRKSLPVLSLALILILVLSTVGVAYGLWAEKLVIDGTVYTGEVDVGFSGPYVYEWVNVNGYPMMEPQVKDPYAECYAKAWDADPNSDGMEGIAVTVRGAYPDYFCLIQFDVSNLGTVPVHVSWPDGEAPSWVQIGACYPNWYQLHPGDHIWSSILIHFTNNDGVSELGTYTFHFTLEALQWNEAPATGSEKTMSTCPEVPAGIEAEVQE